MKRIKKSWMALLLGALLMATLVGVAGARPKASPAYKVTIPAAHFHPNRDGILWYNTGAYISLDPGETSAFFTAALPIALPGRFTVEKMTVFADDGNATLDICAELYRVNPYTYDETKMGEVCTSGSPGNTNRSTTSFSPTTIYGGHGAYIWLTIQDDFNLGLYAVQIQYH